MYRGQLRSSQVPHWSDHASITANGKTGWLYYTTDFWPLWLDAIRPFFNLPSVGGYGCHLQIRKARRQAVIVWSQGPPVASTIADEPAIAVMDVIAWYFHLTVSGYEMISGIPVAKGVRRERKVRICPMPKHDLVFEATRVMSQAHTLAHLLQLPDIHGSRLSHSLELPLYEVDDADEPSE